MAKIVGAITTSHVPAIGGAIHKQKQQDPYWKPFFDGFPPVRDWLARVRPDVAVVIYNDHGLNFFLDKMPTFAVGAAPSYENADEGWGIPTLPPYGGDLDLSWHMIESLVAQEFDITSCQEMLVDHACTIPLELLWPEQHPCPVRIVPVVVNTVQLPLPTPSRCFKFGQAIGKAIESWESDARVVLLGTGGLSHQLDGQRAGFINKAFDLLCMEKIIGDPQWIARHSIHELIELAGTQGVEVLNWLTARAALTGQVSQVHANYHIPISNTASGLMCMAND